MKIAFVSNYFSEGMGYTENMLPKALAHLGHDVHVVTSNLQVYGNQPDYQRSYEAFLGPAICAPGQASIDGFTVHRIPFYSVGNYVGLRRLGEVLRALRPDVVQFGAAAGLPALTTLLRPRSLAWPVFTESHQHASIAWQPKSGSLLVCQCDKLRYRVTRTWPVALAHKRVGKCFAITDDCAETAHRLYGIPMEKIVVVHLGTDTDLFRPCTSRAEIDERKRTRERWSVRDEDILCMYSGRFSAAKNPLLLARAIEVLRQNGQPYRGVFIGEGAQCEAIRDIPGCTIAPFVKHVDLASLYRAADIGVWPCQESMSMLDAAASGLPLVVNDRMGEQERIRGNGCTFRAEDVSSLVTVLLSLRDDQTRQHLSMVGRRKMEADFSWVRHAEIRMQYYCEALS